MTQEDHTAQRFVERNGRISHALDRPLTVQQVAKLIGWHPVAVRKKLDTGDIPSARTGPNARRIWARDLILWLAAQR